MKRGAPVLALLACAGALIAQTARPAILVIGDSNTENGYITGGLRDVIVGVHGNQGSGYFPLMDTLNGRLMGFAGPTPGVNFSIDTSWQRLDMRYLETVSGKLVNRRLADQPFLSPHGFWIESKRTGAKVTITFVGTGVILYFLERQGGGTFSVAVDGVKSRTVVTSGERKSAKVSVAGLASRQHTVTVVVESGAVLFQGVEALRAGSIDNGRAVVHTWGNGCASTTDYTLIDQTVFETALKELDPSAVVVLLGTNDHIADMAPALTVRANLITILQRIKRALPGKGVLLVSTLHIGNRSRTPDPLLSDYLANAYPQAAASTATPYWNMAAWFGPYDTLYMMDYFHCNAAGGSRIGQQLWKELESRFAFASDVARPYYRPMAALTDGITGVGVLRLNGASSDMAGTARGAPGVLVSRGPRGHTGQERSRAQGVQRPILLHEMGTR